MPGWKLQNDAEHSCRIYPPSGDSILVAYQSQPRRLAEAWLLPAATSVPMDELSAVKDVAIVRDIERQPVGQVGGAVDCGR